MGDETKIEREKEREKRKKDLRAVTVEGMKEGARASLFRKLKKEKKGNGRVWLEDGRDDGVGNRDFATSILDEAAIFLATSFASERAYAGTRGKKKATRPRDERYSSISMSECVVRAETKFARLKVAKRDFGERAVERGRKNKYVPEPGSDG
ncbi:hypothetical protein ALC60_07894 [Trachymyrmex zeteki]|uniref:Uncharacterized protein n=1 Tax=Mycetomoellerius zeteki TaxID=64791 RepID=A0A151WZ46_9HYME|nr:hypothetical protein ALC60_07894 [Trachymyrmex zeteki]